VNYAWNYYCQAQREAPRTTADPLRFCDVDERRNSDALGAIAGQFVEFRNAAKIVLHTQIAVVVLPRDPE
jgi:hypothetical protein